MDNNLSFAESCDRTLLYSKIWLAANLPKIYYKKVYILGSWYGNMGLVLNYFNFKIDCIINVDNNSYYCKSNNILYKLAKFKINYKILNKNCNNIELHDADLIINTSTNDINSNKWFNNIKKDTLVAIQCRNNQKNDKNKNRPDSFNEFINSYKLTTLIYKGKLKFNSKDDYYSRYMLIGIK
jgi:hypothetical protein